LRSSEEELPRVIQRKTQTPEYWQSFALSPRDTEFLRTLLLDAERPLSTRELAQALVAERIRREESELRAELAKGTIYQPKKQFKVGDKVLFPQLDYRLGEVVELRAGENPEYGAFEVITVDFGAGKRQRAFAANLAATHKLNADAPDAMAAGPAVDPAAVIGGPARRVPELLREALRAEEAFATVEDRWMPRDLLAEVHVGHLNIAEAVIDMNQAALDTATLQKELDLGKDVSPDIAAFSLEAALAADERFDQVGAGDERRWYLRRLEPAEAFVLPEALRSEAVDYDPDALPPDLEQLAFQLDDEWADEMEEIEERRSAQTATILLTYPHAASGTLPLNRHARPFFPAGQGERTMVMLVDGRWGNRFPAWVNHKGRYIAGLQAWMDKHKLPAGAQVTLERRPDGDVVVDFRAKRMRREWMRWGQLDEDGELDIQLRKQEISCEYDEQIVIGAEKTAEFAAMRARTAQQPLEALVFQVFSDLAGLSGSVNAKTVYSAVNLVRRVTPHPVFAALAADERLERLPDSNFRLVA
jgi:hypothetical protein